MTDQSSNGAGISGLEDTIVATAPTKPAKKAAVSARAFTATDSGADAPEANTEAGREAIKRLQQAVERIEDHAVELRQWAEVRTAQARELIEEKPLTIVGAAFGVGLLLGLIASR